MSSTRRYNDKMSAAVSSAAKRSGGATGAWSKRAGRIDGRAWRDVERALQIGQKRDVHAVEIHGMRFVLRSAHHSPLETTGGKGANMRKDRRPVDPTSAVAPSAPAVPNSAQRRSARRLQVHLQAKAGSGTTGAQDPATPVEPQSEEPARVESDARADAAMAEATGDERRGQKRAADESPACAPPPSAQAAAQAPQQLQPRPADVGGRGREGRGLEPPSSSDYRRMRAEAARADRREGGRG